MRVGLSYSALAGLARRDHPSHLARNGQPPPAEPHAAPALRVTRLSVRYPGSDELALREVSWEVPIGARMALLGPNGAGKSTLLKSIMGLVPPASGEVEVCGYPARAGLPLVSYLPQRSTVSWRFPISVRRMVLTGRYVHLGWLRSPTPEDEAAVEQVLERLGLERLAERQVGQLSGGQQQRALLARALVQDAELVLLDEPLNHVDAETREIFDAVLADLQRRGRTVIFSTHDISALEAGYDGLLYLKDGAVAEPPLGLLHHIQHHVEHDFHERELTDR